MKSLLLDEMLSPRIAEELRMTGADVRGVSESPSLRGMVDGDVLELCREQGRVLITDNIKDFVALNRRWADQGREHPGILFVSAKTFPQDRSRTGRIVTALLARLREDRWPEGGTVGFL